MKRKKAKALPNPKKSSIKTLIDRNNREWHFLQFVGFKSDIYKPLIKRKYGMVMDGKSSENISFRCTQSRKLSCKVRGKLVKSDGNLFTRCEHNHPIDDLLEEENQDNSIDVIEEGGNSENQLLSTSSINKKEKSRQNELINYLFPHCVETKINKNKWLRIEQEEEEENYFKEKEGQFYIDKEGNKWKFVRNIKK
uniref:Uncharacterized protein n=1 Tax=Meloidogyne enterolobii TaxID=390850 RepID=A0A6V7TP82_MELEN|nr:unnamed protein product [Meloidogyne enterolobii]